MCNVHIRNTNTNTHLVTVQLKKENISELQKFAMYPSVLQPISTPKK